MKKIIVLIVISVVAMAFAGCAGGSEDELNIYNWVTILVKM